MRIFTQSFFLSILGLMAATATNVQAQALAPEHVSSIVRLSKAHASDGSPADEARRSLSTTVVRPGQSINYSWNTLFEVWSLDDKQENTYDAGARVTQELFRDSVSAALQRRTLYTYDAQGHQTSSTSQSYSSSTATWANMFRTMASFDARGNETQYLLQSWNGSSWATYSGSQNLYTYNAAGVMTENIRQRWENGTFVNDEREVYTLTNGQWSSLVLQTWENGVWEDNQRIMDVVWYDWAALKPASYKKQEFNGTAFVDDERSTVVYASNGSRTTTVEAYTGAAWQLDSRYSERYDNFGNYLGYDEEEYSGGAWKLSYGSRNLLFYNASNVVLRQVSQRFDNTSQQWQNQMRANYSNFQNITLALVRNTALEARAELYPNPAAGRVTLSVANVRGTTAAAGEVRNALGQLVQQFAVQPQQGQLTTQLDLSRLQPGVYSVSLHTPEGLITKRVVRN